MGALGGELRILVKNNRVCFLVKHPSGDGDAAYQFVIKIDARVLVFIKDYQAQV